MVQLENKTNYMSSFSFYLKSRFKSCFRKTMEEIFVETIVLPEERLNQKFFGTFRQNKGITGRSLGIYFTVFFTRCRRIVG